MRKYALALVAFALLTGLPCVAAEAPAAALAEPQIVAAAPAPSPATEVPTQAAGEVQYWIQAETPVMPQWLKLAGCAQYCMACGGCCALPSPGVCACC